MARSSKQWWSKLAAFSVSTVLLLVLGITFFTPKASAAASFSWKDDKTITVSGWDHKNQASDPDTFDMTCGTDGSKFTCAPSNKKLFRCNDITLSMTSKTSGTIIYDMLSGGIGNASPVKVCTQGTNGDNITVGNEDAAPDTLDNNVVDPDLECGPHTSLDWFLCPLVIGVINRVVGSLDGLINTLLTVDQVKIFGENGKRSATAQGYYSAWNSFRIIALALIVISGLVMVIATALGFEVVDAYTLKKIMPRMVVAIIAIALSWYLMEFFVTLTNNLGLGIRQIIFYPFKDIPGSLSLGGGARFVTALLSAGALFALGVGGLLSFGLTAALAVLIAFLVLMIRQLVIIALILFAPIAIACSILPNTQGAYKLWYESFTKALLMFPIIIAFISIGRVFALVSIGTDITAAPAISQIIGFSAYFLPYFLIPLTFSLAGGALRFIGGRVNDTSRGGFDRLKKYRQNTMARRGHEWKNGSLYQDRGAGKLINNTGRRFNAGVRGRFGVGRTGRASLGLATAAGIQDTLKNNASLNELQNNDDANAVLGFSGGSRGGARQAVNELKTGWYNDKKSSLDTQLARGDINQTQYDTSLRQTTADLEVRGQDAYAGANAIGFSRQNAAAALQTVARNKSRAIGAGRSDIVQNGISRLAGGNDAEASGLGFSYQYFSREAGRADLGGNWMGAREDGAKLAAATGISQAEAEQHVTTLDGMGRTDVTAMTRGHGSQMKQYAKTSKFLFDNGSAAQKELAATRLLELQKNITYASGDNQKLINGLMADVGVDYTQSASVEQQLSDLLASKGVSGIDAVALTRAARTYDREAYEAGTKGVVKGP